MKKLFLGLLSLLAVATTAWGVDVKISQLPLGSASTTTALDSFPFVSNAVNITKRMTLWDLINIPPFTTTYAPIASPTFTGTVTAPTFVGSLTGNATNVTGTVAVGNGGTGLTSGTTGTILRYTASNTLAGTTATYPASTTANQLLYSSSNNVIAGLSTAATSALVTSSSSIPSLTSGSTANRVLRTDGTTVSFAQVAAGTDISGQVAIANGGTGAATKAAGYDALSPMSALGDLVYGGASGTGTRLAGNTAASQKFLAQTGTGSVSAAPVWTTAPTPTYTAPTIQKFASGSGTYTTPANVLYIRVRMIGGGGGGAGNASVSGGSDGGNSTFGTTLLVANGGGKASGRNTGTGGTASLGTGPIGTATQGAQGQGSSQVVVNQFSPGGQGAATPFGGGGGGGSGNSAGNSAIANTGAGGGGAGANGVASNQGGAGGAAGGYVDALISSPAGSYSYAVGAAGSGSTGGNFNGGDGGSGYIVVTEYYQ